MNPVAPAELYEAVVEWGATGATIGMRVVDNEGATTVARVVGFTEYPAGSGIYYRVGNVAPAAAGAYTLVYDDDGGTAAVGHVATEELIVSYSAAAAAASLPCGEWITGADVATVCGDAPYASDPSWYDSYALTASQVLYELSGRQFSGVCGPVTVRPCVRSCSCWFPGSSAFWSAGGGYWLGGGGSGVSAIQDCGSGGGCCGALSRVKLAGYPVQEIEEVKINGAVIAAENYRLDGHKWLTYLNDTDGGFQRWPACQNLARADTEEGTFSVEYTYGADPPSLGQDAAAQLACALSATGEECGLPPGTSRVNRLGIQIEMLSNKKGVPISFASIPLVQLFLEAYNPAGLRRRSAAWSPDITPYAQKVG